MMTEQHIPTVTTEDAMQRAIPGAKFHASGFHAYILKRDHNIVVWTEFASPTTVIDPLRLHHIYRDVLDGFQRRFLYASGSPPGYWVQYYGQMPGDHLNALVANLESRFGGDLLEIPIQGAKGSEYELLTTVSGDQAMLLDLLQRVKELEALVQSLQEQIEELRLSE